MSGAPLGVIGGTFDPVHLGHLRLAEELGERLRLAEVRFVPAGTPPHRDTPHADASDRLAMVRLAVAGNPRFTVDDREVRRAGPGYTVDTLTALRAEAGAEQPIVFILGADAFLGFAAWHRWQAIFEFAHLAVAHRPGLAPGRWEERMPRVLADAYAARRLQEPLDVHGRPAGGIAVVPFTALDISASLIRERLRAGSSPRYLLPDPVIEYIRTHRLYERSA